MQAITPFNSDLHAVSRGWQLGDGHFTTVHAPFGRLRHWRYHQARLTAACARLMMPAPDWPALMAEIHTLLDANADQVLRITLVRGVGGRGYSVQGCSEPQVLLSLAPFPSNYYQWRQQGITIGVCAGRLGTSPLLAGLKTINRLEQVLLKAELEAQRWPEALVLDSQEQVQEAVTANVFWRKGSQIFTPPLTESGVWGTLRAWCQDYLGERLSLTDAPLSQLLAADEVWLSNALLGIVPVLKVVAASSANPVSATTPRIGATFTPDNLKITKELQQAYEKTN